MKGRQMYRENIIDHYKNPRNKGCIENADISIEENNPSCGDVIEWFVKIEDGEITEVKFEGRGCAISQASTSMLTDKVKGKTIEEVEDIEKEQIFDMLGVDLTPLRIKCALLGLKALKKALFIHKNGGGKT